MDTLTAAMLAEALQEPEKTLLARVLRQLGQERCAAILADTLAVESNGGMLIKSGARRRTPGGVFFELVKERCAGKERHYLFAPRPVKHASPGKPQAAQAPAPAPIALTLHLWKGLTPMPVTATLKLVLRDLPETRESGGMVYMALQHEPRGLPRGISLDSGPLYLTSPVKQWRTACTKAAEIRALGTPALLIIEAHISARNLLPAKAGSFHAGRWPAEAHWTIRVYRPGYFRASRETLLSAPAGIRDSGLFLKHFTLRRNALNNAICFVSKSEAVISQERVPCAHTEYI